MSNKTDENNPEIAPAILIQTDVNWDTNSIGEADDLILHNEEPTDPTTEVAKPPDPKRLENAKLGFNLPTNDSTKLGQLDNLSVDSYWVGENELVEIEKEKHNDPVNVDYKGVYLKLRDRASQQEQEQEESKPNKSGSPSQVTPLKANESNTSLLTVVAESSLNK